MISKSNVKFTDSNIKFTDSEVSMASRFASSTRQEIEQLLEDKDLENNNKNVLFSSYWSLHLILNSWVSVAFERSTKVAKELFYEYLKE